LSYGRERQGPKTPLGERATIPYPAKTVKSKHAHGTRDGLPRSSLNRSAGSLDILARPTNGMATCKNSAAQTQQQPRPDDQPLKPAHMHLPNTARIVDSDGRCPTRFDRLLTVTLTESTRCQSVGFCLIHGSGRRSGVVARVRTPKVSGLAQRAKPRDGRPAIVESPWSFSTVPGGTLCSVSFLPDHIAAFT